MKGTVTAIRLIALPLLLVAIILLTGCTPWIETAQGQTANVPVGEIYGTHTVGQTFVPRWGGLSGVEVFLATYARQNTQPLIFHLRETPESTENLATVTIPASEIADNAFQTFAFPSMTDSTSRRYYFVLESPTARPGDAFTAWRGPADSYVDGALYLAGRPQDGQLIFRLHYDPLRLWASLLLEVAQAIPWGLALVVLFLLPGMALLVWLGPADAVNWTELLTVAPALSVALLPLLLLWAHVVHLRLGPLVMAGLLVLAAAALLARLRHDRLSLRGLIRPSLPSLLLVVVFVMVLVTRWLVARGLEVPMWGDSYQHTMLAQLLAERGGLFQSWEPYVALRSLTYHFGFHSVVAAEHWLSGQAMPISVIEVGQALNVLAVLSLYPLAVYLTGNRWAGIIAVLVAGLLFPMPQYYLNWGRYTQLAGQVVLPIAILLTLRAFENRSRREYLLAGLAVAGLALTHYRVFLFYVCFLLAWVPFQIVKLKQTDVLTRGRQTVVRLSLLAGIVLLLDLPWLRNLFASHLAKMYGQMARGQSTAFVRTTYNAVGDIHPYLPAGLLAVMLLAGLWALLRNQRNAIVLIVWTFFLLLLANPSLIGLPGTGVVNNFAVFIALYIPGSLLIGFLLGDVVSAAQRWRSSAGFAVIVLILVTGVWAGRARVQARDAQFQMVTRPDVEAMAWIRQNTPPDARFLVNGFKAYGGSVVVGADAGWWIPLLAGRANTVPPLVYGAEKADRPEMRQELLAFYDRVLQADFDTAETAAWLRKNKVTYVYLGQRRGRIGAGEKRPLEVDDFLDSPYFRPVYHHDLVWIFALSGG